MPPHDDPEFEIDPLNTGCDDTNDDRAIVIKVEKDWTFEPLSQWELEETQATNLPRMTIRKWERMDESMKSCLFSPVYFPTWHAEVTAILQKLELHRFVDSSIPRPSREHPKFIAWKVCSTKLAHWLRSHTAQPLDTTLEMCFKEKDVTFADDWMRELKALIGDPYGYTARRKACLAIWDCRKNDFEDMEEFLAQIKRRYRVAKNLKTGITPYQVAMMVLEEVRWVEAYEVLVSFKEKKLEMRGEAVLDMTESELWELCDELEDFAGHTGETKSKFDAACPRRGR